MSSPNRARARIRLAALATALPLVVAAALVSAPAQAAEPPPPIYRVSILPFQANIVDMSGAGHIAGINYPDGQPFVWTPSGGVVVLPTPTGARNPNVVGVNSSGWVAGALVANGTTLGVVWQPTATGYTMVTLPRPTDLGPPMPIAIDDASRVIGSAGVPGKPWSYPFLWTADGGSVSLVSLGYPTDLPTSISPTTGWVATPTSAYRLGDPATVVPLPPAPASFSYVYTHAIADDGDRFVLAQRPSSMYAARLFRVDAQTATWIDLWGSDIYSWFHGVTDVNARGDMVGFRNYSAEVSWAPGAPSVNLQTRLAGGYTGVPTDSYAPMLLSGAAGISDTREVLASASLGNSGRMVRLTPTGPCTAATCLQVSALTVGGTQPSTCTTGATYTASGTATVRDQSGRAVPKATVRVLLIGGNTTVVTTTTTDRKGVAKFSGKLETCGGTVTAFVDDVTLAGAELDRSVGILGRSALPSVR